MCFFPPITQTKCAKKPSSQQPAHYIQDPLSRIQYPVSSLPPYITIGDSTKKRSSPQPVILISPPPAPSPFELSTPSFQPRYSNPAFPSWTNVDPYTAHERRRRSSLFHDIDTLQKLGEKFNPSSKEKEKEKGRREEEAANLKEEVVKLRGDFNKKAREDELKEAVSSAKAEGVKVGEESERQRRKRESGAALAMGLGFGGWGPQLGGGMEVDGDVKLHLHRHVLDGGRGDGGLGLAERDDLDVGRRALVDPSYAGGGARMMLDRVRNVEARQNELDMEFQRGREREREREGLRISRWRYP